MIDKVDLNNYYNNYKVGGVRKVDGDQNVFPLDDKGPGVVYEPSAGAADNQRGLAGRQVKETAPETQKTESVILDLSSTRTLKEELPGEGTESTLSGGIARFLTGVVNFFKSFFDSVWNGTADTAQEKTDDAEGESATGSMNASEAVDALKEDTAIKELLDSRDMSKLEQYLTKNGEKQAARNTDLLTFYDKKGQIVKVDPSDKKKILEGTFDEIKL